MAELGETVGILAAQSIGEPGTQLTMRTFHTGGIFSGKVAQTIISPVEGTIYYNSIKGGKKINTKYKEKAFVTTENKKITIYRNKLKKYEINLPKHSIICAKPNQKIFKKQIIAQITKEEKEMTGKKMKEIKEIKTTLTGFIYNEKKRDYSTYNNDKIWLISSNIITFSRLFKNSRKKINFIHRRKILRQNVSQINKFNISKKLLKIVKKSYKINKNKTIINFFIQNKIAEKKEFITKKQKTEKILEAKNNYSKCGSLLIKEKLYTRKTKNLYCSQTIQTRKNISFIKKAKIYNVTKKINELKKYPLTIRKNNTLFFIEYKKQKTEDIVQGLPKVEELLEAKKTISLKKIKNNAHEKLQKYFLTYNKRYNNEVAVRKSIEKIQKILINKVQNVYQSQGVTISNKHIEIIIKQMTSKIIVIKKGNSNFICGEIVELLKVEKINKEIENKIFYEPLIMGISKLSLTNESFIAEASFQETTKILTKSAIEGKIDWLYGLKENLIMGNLIPAGTGNITLEN